MFMTSSEEQTAARAKFLNKFQEPVWKMKAREKRALHESFFINPPKASEVRTDSIANDVMYVIGKRWFLAGDISGELHQIGNAGKKAPKSKKMTDVEAMFKYVINKRGVRKPLHCVHFEEVDNRVYATDGKVMLYSPATIERFGVSGEYDEDGKIVAVSSRYPNCKMVLADHSHYLGCFDVDALKQLAYQLKDIDRPYDHCVMTIKFEYKNGPRERYILPKVLYKTMQALQALGVNRVNATAGIHKSGLVKFDDVETTGIGGASMGVNFVLDPNICTSYVPVKPI